MFTYYYFISCNYNSRDGVEPVLQSENGDAEQHDVLTDICPSGEWDVSVWAVNEYGGIGSASTISITISNGNCISELYY